jgi:hypothetical protein
MVFAVGNYIGLLVALLLPVLGFYVFNLPDNATSAVAMLSLGLTLAVWVGLAWPGAVSANTEVERHFGIQKQVLLIFVIGGLLSSLRFYLYYDQFRVRFNLSEPLLVVTSILWVISVTMILRGLLQSCIALRHPPKYLPPSK